MLKVRSKWLASKTYGSSMHRSYFNPVIENDEDRWSVNNSYVSGLSSFELYSDVYWMISCETAPKNFQCLLKELTRLNEGRQLLMDPALFDPISTDYLQYGTDNFSLTNIPPLTEPRPITVSDLVFDEKESKELNFSYVNCPNILWLASHLAIIEMILRIYLSNIVCSKRLLDTLSTVIGCQIEEKSIQNLQGADGALFWLVVVAARTASLLRIKDCSDWLINHLLEVPKSVDHVSSISSADSVSNASSDSLSESADRFLRGLAMANLIALVFCFYLSELITVEDFHFGFSACGNLEPAASHHNARVIATICRNNPELYCVLTMMPDSCSGLFEYSINEPHSSVLSTLNLLGFCSQGLARSPTHKRLQHAAMAADLFMYFSSRMPNKQLPPLRQVELLNKSECSNNNHSDLKDDNLDELFQTQPTDCVFNTTEKLDFLSSVVVSAGHLTPTVSDTISHSGKGTYRLEDGRGNIYDKNSNDFYQKNNQVIITAKPPQSPYNMQLLNNRLDEISTRQFTSLSEKGFFLPNNFHEKSQSFDNVTYKTISFYPHKSKEIISQPSQRPIWNPLSAMFKTNKQEKPQFTPDVKPLCEDQNNNFQIGNQTKITGPYASIPAQSIPEKQVFNIEEKAKINQLPENFDDEKLATRSPIRTETHGSTYFESNQSKAFRSLSQNSLPLKVSSNQLNTRFNLLSPDIKTRYPFSSIYQTENEIKNGHKDRYSYIIDQKSFKRPQSWESGSHKVDNTFQFFDEKLNSIFTEKNENFDQNLQRLQSLSPDFIHDYDERFYHREHFLKEPRAVTNYENFTREHLAGYFHRFKRSSRHPRRTKAEHPLHYYYHPVPLSTVQSPQIQFVYPIERVSSPVLMNYICSDQFNETHSHLQNNWIRSPPYIANMFSPTQIKPPAQTSFVITEPMKIVDPTVLGDIQTFEDVKQSQQQQPEKNMVYSTDTIKDKKAPSEIENKPNPMSDLIRFNNKNNKQTLISKTEADETKIEETELQNISVAGPIVPAQTFFIPFDTHSEPDSSIRPHAKTIYKIPRYREYRFKTNLSSSKNCNVNTLESQNNHDSEVLIARKSSLNKKNEIKDSKTPKPPLASPRSKTISPQSLSIVEQSQMKKLKNENERQKRERIFQAYLERKSSGTSERESRSSDTSRPSSGRLNTIRDQSVQKKGLTNNLQKNKTKNIEIRRSASMTRPTPVKNQSLNEKSSQQTKDELSLLATTSASKNQEIQGTTSELKLFVQLQVKSNRRVISNAINHCCLAGPVNEDVKRTALEALNCSNERHFMILLRSNCQYSGLYSYSTALDKAMRLSGNGPSKINSNMVAKFYKYDSGSKRFTEIDSTSHLSTVVDAVLLHERSRNMKSYAAPTISPSTFSVHGK